MKSQLLHKHHKRYQHNHVYNSFIKTLATLTTIKHGKLRNCTEVSKNIIYSIKYGVATQNGAILCYHASHKPVIAAAVRAERVRPHPLGGRGTFNIETS
jgi:hypothetical protein